MADAQGKVDDQIANELVKSLAQTLGSSFAQIVAGLRQAFDPLKNVNAAIQAASEKAAKAEDALTTKTNSAASAMQSLVQTINQLISQMGGTLTAVAAPSAKKSAAAPELEGGSGLEALGIAAGGIAVAATAAIGAVQGMISKLGEFVTALSPGSMQQFSQSLRDLQATVGVAFQPIFAILTDTIRQAAGIILPVMQQLRPVIEEVTQVFASNLLTKVQGLADIFSSLMPIIKQIAVLMELLDTVTMPVVIAMKLLAPLFSLLTIAMQPVTDVLKIMQAALDGINQIFDVMIRIVGVLVQMFVTFIQSLFGGIPLKDILAAMTQAVKGVINALVIFTATLLKFFGISLQPLIDAFDKKSGETASGPPQIRGFEQISKDLQLAAAGAGGTGTAKPEDLLKETVEQLKRMQAGTDKGNETVTKILADISGYLKILADAAKVAAAPAAAATYLKDTGELVYNNPLGTLKNLFGLGG